MTDTVSADTPLDSTAVTTRPARVMGFSELKSWLRHRHPMVFLDRVVDYEPGSYLTAMVQVSGQTDAIAGHFPERGIFPASHILQAIAQSAIILLQLSTSPLAEDEITLVGSVNARFTRIVVPGDRIILNTTTDRVDGRFFPFSCRATVDDRPAAAVRGMLARVDIADLGEQLW